MRYLLGILALCASFCGYAKAADDSGLVEMKWQVEGVDRSALVYIPPDAQKTDAPVVFAFHGHGGTARAAARQFNFQKHWPDAISVYMQGLPTVTTKDPEGTKPGWQHTTGEVNDRDLKFFDAVLATLKKDYKVDAKRIYCTGHSNGGVFTYLLWAVRGDVFAAVAPSAAVSLVGIKDGNAALALGLDAAAKAAFKDVKPLPAMHIAGENDMTVPYAYQVRTMAEVRSLNGCDADGKPWAQVGNVVATLFPSSSGTPFVSVIYPGSHASPAEAPQLIVKFFKEHSKSL